MPHTIAQFSQLKHLARGDLILRPEKVLIILKWSKTMQTIKLSSVPSIPNSTICPVVAIKNLLDLTPRGSNLLLFRFKLTYEWIPLTDDNRIRCHFGQIWGKLNLSQLVLPSTHSTVQVPPLLLTMMLLFKIFRSVVPGRLTVCGGTLLIL